MGIWSSHLTIEKQTYLYYLYDYKKLVENFIVPISYISNLKMFTKYDAFVHLLPQNGSYIFAFRNQRAWLLQKYVLKQDFVLRFIFKTTKSVVLELLLKYKENISKLYLYKLYLIYIHEIQSCLDRCKESHSVLQHNWSSVNLMSWALYSTFNWSWEEREHGIKELYVL